MPKLTFNPLTGKFDNVLAPTEIQTVFLHAKEENTSAITKGQAVAITGSSGSKIVVGLADCTSTTHDRIVGVASQDITQNSTSYIIMSGILTGVDTRTSNTDVNPNAETWAAGDLLWLDGGGGLTNVRPASGRCIKVARTVKGNNASDELIVIAFENPAWVTGASGEDIVLRTGDSAGSNKISLRDYDNNEVAYFDSDGKLYTTGNVEVAKADPEIRMTDTGDSEYTRITKADTDGVAQRFNRVYEPGGQISNLVAQWSCNDNAADTTVTDSSGNGNTGTASVNTSTMSTSGKVNTAFNLATNRYFGASGQLASAYPFSMFAWIYGTTGKLGAIFVLADASSSTVYYGVDMTTNGVVRLFASNGGWNSFNTSDKRYDDGVWHLIECRFVSDTVKQLYIDRELKGTLTASVTYNTDVDRWDVGRFGDLTPTANCTLVVDETRFYGKEVSDAEANVIWNSGNGTEDNILAGSNTEISIWKSEDGVTSDEEGILTIGDDQGETNLQGSELIFNIGGTEQVQITDGTIQPITDDDIDLGASGAEFKDAYLDGTLYADEAEIGDGTNQAVFAADGELTLAGTARVKKEFTLPLTDFNPGASGPTAALHDIFPSYEFTIDDDMHTTFEVPTDWAVGTDITIEVYWGINEAYATNSGEVQWSATWRAIEVGEVISGGSSGTIDFGDVNIPATANTIVKTEGTISGASLSAQDLVALNGARIDLDDGSNPAAEPYIIMVNMEYTADKLGEAT